MNRPRISARNSPVVAIVGRPNVGKSALFNRLTGRRTAIVQDTPGITRDRIYGLCEWTGNTFTVVDTGGIDPKDPDILRKQVHQQARVALEEAAVIMMVVDARAGVHPLDEEVAEILRKHGKPVLLVANKAESEVVENAAYEFYSLGLGDPFPVSAIHGVNTGDLLDKVLELLPEMAEEEETDEVSLVLVGRPNVGKSSMLNRLIGEERSIVHHEAGTTRDSVDTLIEFDGRPIRLVDTAGLRRKAKVEEDVEYFSSVRAARALERADVALLVLDAQDGVVAQDQRVAGEIHKQGKASVILVNKWDLLHEMAPDPTKIEAWKREFTKKLAADLDFLSYSPVLFVSALTGQNTDEILTAALEVAEETNRRVATPLLNQVIREAMALRPPPGYKGEHLKVRYASQRGVKPPTFALKCNSPKLVHFSYRRYLENQIRAAFGFVGTPIELKFVK